VPRRVPRLGHDDREEVKRIAEVRRLLQSVNLGATAIGTTVTAAPGYPALAVKHLSAIIGIEFGLAEDLIEATSDTGDYVLLSGVLKHTSANLTKICNDIRMLASGPRCGLNELNLPQMQPGSSITPGKVDPVIPEVVNQTGFLVIGLDLTVTLAASAGQLQLNVMEPVITFALFASIATMERAVTSLRVNCVQGITAHAERTRDMVLNSLGIVTLKPSLGYKQCAEIVHEGHVTGKSLHDIVVKERQLLTQQKWDEVFFLGKDLKDDPEYQARLASGAIPPPKAAADRPPLKPGATLSAVLFLIAVTLVVLFGFFPSLRELPGAKTPLAMPIVIEIVMLSVAAVMLMATMVPVDEVPKTSTLRAGVVAVLGIFGLAWLGDSFIAANWDTARRLPWGVLMLFGGGLTLAAAIEANGVSAFIGHASRGLAGLPPLLLVLAITAMTVFLSELTSNTAQVSSMVPVLAAMAPVLGMNPYVLILACTLGASSAYMMPVGTPPNAIVFGTGLVRLPQMMRAGFLMNLVGILVITALAALFIAPLLGNPR
jgi:Na+/H+ antiporter NhaD/arsenite permease-like protein